MIREKEMAAKQMMMFLSCFRVRLPHPPRSWSYSSRALEVATEKKKKKQKEVALIKKEKRRTRSSRKYENDGTAFEQSHVPVMLGEVVDVFSSRSVSSFVDCTLGVAGHSSAIIESHPELQVFVGMDVDPVAYELARTRIGAISSSRSEMKSFMFLHNFKHVRSVLSTLQLHHVDAILMDMGVSSLQVNCPERGFSVLADGPLDMRMDPKASLKAEDIVNSWPETEVGRVLRDYGEESKWRLLRDKILEARKHGGLHSTAQLAELVRKATPARTGGRQGWMKTSTRVFQALRIAVNDELKTLEHSLDACFDSLAPGGRLAVISFHSLEDRIVKQTFLRMVGQCKEDADDSKTDSGRQDAGVLTKRQTEMREDEDKESWIRQMIQGQNGVVLTKRPITPSEEEERSNRRCRSAKLRVIQKV